MGEKETPLMPGKTGVNAAGAVPGCGAGCPVLVRIVGRSIDLFEYSGWLAFTGMDWVESSFPISPTTCPRASTMEETVGKRAHASFAMLRMMIVASAAGSAGLINAGNVVMVFTCC